MKKRFMNLLGAAVLLGAAGATAAYVAAPAAQDDSAAEEQAVSVVWALDSESTDATVNPAGFGETAMTLGTNLAYKNVLTYDEKSYYNLKFNEIGDIINLNQGEQNQVHFTLTPTAEMEVTEVSFSVLQDGWGDCRLSAFVTVGDKKVELCNTVTPTRNNDSYDATKLNYSYNIEDLKAQKGEVVDLTLVIFTKNSTSGNNKGTGISNVTILGKAVPAAVEPDPVVPVNSFEAPEGNLVAAFGIDNVENFGTATVTSATLGSVEIDGAERAAYAVTSSKILTKVLPGCVSVTPEGGFKAGDVLTVKAGFKSETVTEDLINIMAIDAQDNAVNIGTPAVANLATEKELTVFTYTFEADYASVNLNHPTANSTLYLAYIAVVGERVAEPDPVDPNKVVFDFAAGINDITVAGTWTETAYKEDGSVQAWGHWQPVESVSKDGVVMTVSCTSTSATSQPAVYSAANDAYTFRMYGSGTYTSTLYIDAPEGKVITAVDATSTQGGDNAVTTTEGSTVASTNTSFNWSNAEGVAKAELTFSKQFRITELTVTLADAATVEPDPVEPGVRTWNFTKWSDETVANLVEGADWSDIEKAADSEPTELSKGNCFWQVKATEDLNADKYLMANNVVISELEGLVYTNTADRSLAIAVNYVLANADETKFFGPYHGGSYLWLGSSKKNYFLIPQVLPGSVIKMGVESHKINDARGVELYVGEGTSGAKLTGVDGEAVAAPTTYQDQVWQVPADLEAATDIQIYNTNGCHIYYITVEDPGYVAPDVPATEVVDFASLLPEEAFMPTPGTELEELQRVDFFFESQNSFSVNKASEAKIQLVKVEAEAETVLAEVGVNDAIDWDSTEPQTFPNYDFAVYEQNAPVVGPEADGEGDVEAPATSYSAAVSVVFFEEAITEAGSYKVVIPEGFFLNGEAPVGAYEAAYTIVAGETPDEPKVVSFADYLVSGVEPAAGTVEYVNNVIFTLKNNKQILANMFAGVNITLDRGEEVLATITGYDKFDAEDETMQNPPYYKTVYETALAEDGTEEYYTTVTLAFAAESFTEPGKYTVTIPENFFNADFGMIKLGAYTIDYEIERTYNYPEVTGTDAQVNWTFDGTDALPAATYTLPGVFSASEMSFSDGVVTENKPRTANKGSEDAILMSSWNFAEVGQYASFSATPAVEFVPTYASITWGSIKHGSVHFKVTASRGEEVQVLAEDVIPARVNESSDDDDKQYTQTYRLEVFENTVDPIVIKAEVIQVDKSRSIGFALVNLTGVVPEGVVIPGGDNVEEIAIDLEGAQVYDLSGREVKGQPAPGIYVVVKGGKAVKAVIR